MADQNKAFEALSAAGIEVNKLTESQRRVVETLSQQEINTLVSIKKRMDGSSDVQGYLRSDDTGVLIF